MKMCYLNLWTFFQCSLISSSILIGAGVSSKEKKPKSYAKFRQFQAAMTHKYIKIGKTPLELFFLAVKSCKSFPDEEECKKSTFFRVIE